MKFTAIALTCGVLVFGGCASNRAYRPTAAGGMGAPSGAAGIPDSTPSLGSPSPTLPGQGNTSAYPPVQSGPSLGGPEARRKKTPAKTLPAAKLEAPDPEESAIRYRPETAAAPVSSTSRPSILDEPTWSRFYRSSDNRPIETLIMGNGPARVAIISSLHGDEIQSVSVVENLARSLRAHPEYLRQSTVLLVKSPNPDGFFARTPYNIRGVDLNRNFPAANWKELQNSRAGTRAGSEAETRVIARVLGDFHPQLLVHLKDSRNGGVVNYEGDVKPRADQIAGMLSSQVVQGLGEKTSGSVENYALTRLNCPSLTMLLVREDSNEAAWAKTGEALFAILGPGQSPLSRIEDASNSSSASSALNGQPDPFDDSPAQKPSTRRQPTASDSKPGKIRSTAQSTSRAPLPDFPAPIPETGYLELPPPGATP